jgi:hypothetical protein
MLYEQSSYKDILSLSRTYSDSEILTVCVTWLLVAIILLLLLSPALNITQIEQKNR